MGNSIFLSSLIVGLVGLGCTSTTTETRVISSDISAGTGSSGGSDGTDGLDGTPGTTTASDGLDGSDDMTDGIDGLDGAVATDSETTSSDGADGPVNQCGVVGDGKGIGEPCLSHAECSTGYCYDEAYLNEDGNQTYRFCTAKCAGCTTVGNCNEWPMAPGIKANTCYIFKTAFINEYNIQADSLCLPTCSSDADCAGLGPFNTCGKVQYGWSEGEECFGGVQKVCRPAEFAGPSCD